MKVTINSPQKLGNRDFKHGQQEVPDSLAYNRQFKKLVALGVIKVHARDAVAQKVQLSRDAKAVQKAQAARKAARAARQAALAAQIKQPVASVAPGASQAAPAASAKGAIKPGKATTVTVAPAKAAAPAKA